MTTPFSAALIGVPSGTEMLMPSLRLPSTLAPYPAMTAPRTGQRYLAIPVAFGEASVVSSFEATSVTDCLATGAVYSDGFVLSALATLVSAFFGTEAVTT
ncbi:hypothetical protein D3C87_1774020 [compost metagenome]